MLNGGLPNGSWTRVLGAPGSGKSTLSRQFLYRAATRQQPAVLLSTADPPELVREGMFGFEWGANAINRIKFLDFYCWSEGARRGNDARNLMAASLAVTKFFETTERAQDGGPCLLIDSFTDFLLHNPAEAALSFLGQLGGRLQPREVTALALLEPGVHPQDMVATTELVSDGVIRTKVDETGRNLPACRVRSTPVTLGWWEFTIQKGIDLFPRDFFGGRGN